MPNDTLIIRVNRETGTASYEQFPEDGLTNVHIILDAPGEPGDPIPVLGYVDTNGSRPLRSRPVISPESYFAVTNGTQHLAVYAESADAAWWRVIGPQGLWIKKSVCGRLIPPASP